MATPFDPGSGAALLIVFLSAAGFCALWRTWRGGWLFERCRRALPRLSASEAEALAAGGVGPEGEFFRGRPDWARLLATPAPRLSAAEQAFLDEEVETACRLVDDWRAGNELHDLPPAAWRHLREKGFFGLVIPSDYGGLGFSPYAHSQVVARLASRSSALAVTVMVPNSLGPAELLLRYGTETQKLRHLPRLASGLEIPAFALTSPWAGSDAAALPDVGIVCRGVWQGREVLGMRVSWNKRYITLAPVCTLLGLAFRLFDPDGLLGCKGEIGTTCALVPHDHPGVEIGRRHQPLGAAFMNGPTRGREVFMPLDFIIGGPAMAGQGWRMVMECLAAGRAVSLPAAQAGISQLAARSVGGYARVRSQFWVPLAAFEGVEEVLARIAGHTYMIDAIRRMAAAGLASGEAPALLAAIAKYLSTELGRQVVNDGMDVLGGKGVCMGPSNLLAAAYQQIPIAITVEGANILTRSLILFGQGAMRCHPWLAAEAKALAAGRERGGAAFRAALRGHLGYFARGLLRALALAWGGERLAAVPPGSAPECVRHFRRLSRLAAAFALVSEVVLLLLGGSLKRREKLSGRLGDILAHLCLAAAVLKRYHDEGCRSEDAALMHWALATSRHRIGAAFDGLFANLPAPRLAGVLRFLLFPSGLAARPPADTLGREAARLLVAPSAARDRLTAACHLPRGSDEPLAAIEAALAATLAAEPIEARIRAAERQGRFAGEPLANVRDIAGVAFGAGIIDLAEFEILLRRNALRDRVIQVDDFPFRQEDAAAARKAA